MRNRLSTIAFALSIIGLSITSCEKEQPVVKQEQGLRSLYGTYCLKDVFWTGPQVDLDYDGKAQRNLQEELQRKIGFYEPNYFGVVCEDSFTNEKEPDVSVFNVVLPYPFYLLSGEDWKCSRVCDMKYSFRLANDDFFIGAANCTIRPAYQDDGDLFLSSISEVCVIVESYEKQSFRVRVHCKLPYDFGIKQQINEGYIYYTFQKNDGAATSFL